MVHSAGLTLTDGAAKYCHNCPSPKIPIMAGIGWIRSDSSFLVFISLGVHIVKRQRWSLCPKPVHYISESKGFGGLEIVKFCIFYCPLFPTVSLHEPQLILQFEMVSDSSLTSISWPETVFVSSCYGTTQGISLPERTHEPGSKGLEWMKLSALEVVSVCAIDHEPEFLVVARKEQRNRGGTPARNKFAENVLCCYSIARMDLSDVACNQVQSQNARRVLTNLVSKILRNHFLERWFWLSPCGLPDDECHPDSTDIPRSSKHSTITGSLIRARMACFCVM